MFFSFSTIICLYSCSSTVERKSTFTSESHTERNSSPPDRHSCSSCFFSSFLSPSPTVGRNSLRDIFDGLSFLSSEDSLISSLCGSEDLSSSFWSSAEYSSELFSFYMRSIYIKNKYLKILVI